MKTETQTTIPAMMPFRAAEIIRIFNLWRREKSEWRRKTIADLPFNSDDIDLALDLAVEVLSSEYTGRSVDYDRLADAARHLRAACKGHLTPSWYAQVHPECRAVDDALNP